MESIASGSSDGDFKINLRFHYYARINFIRSMISSHSELFTDVRH